MKIENRMRAEVRRPIDLVGKSLLKQRRAKLPMGSRLDVETCAHSLFELISIDEWPLKRKAHHAFQHNPSTFTYAREMRKAMAAHQFGEIVRSIAARRAKSDGAQSRRSHGIQGSLQHLNLAWRVERRPDFMPQSVQTHLMASIRHGPQRIRIHGRVPRLDKESRLESVQPL